MEAAAALQLAPLAMPGAPTDETKVPHYFGPYPNWANSPFTLPDVAVDILGDGTGAAATATVGANGAVTGITITIPGSGYTAATVNITGGGIGAAAGAIVSTTGVVTGIVVVTPGAGYTSPAVTISGGGATTDAMAVAYGGVDTVALTSPGIGYTFPTVDFDLPDDPNGVPAVAHAVWDATTGAITGIVLDQAGSGYTSAPNVVIRDGTLFDPINNGASGATAAATLSVQSVAVATFGAGYTSAPTVVIADAVGAGGGATATATTDAGAVTAVNVTAPGSGYLTTGGIRKFTDPLPELCDPAAGCPSSGKYIPLAVPEVKTYNGVEADEYVIGLVQYRTSFSSSQPPSLLRGYVQLETPANAGISQHIPLSNELLDGTQVSTGYLAVTPPQFLGPVIVATKDRAVRIVFRNLLPTGDGGDIFLPVDTTIMGSGMSDMNEPFDPVPATGGDVMDMVRNPMCTDALSMGDMCFLKNRATLHLHGGNTPWISDGTPHQWITPAGETTTWPEGVSVENVPDMDVCNAADDGCQTFYYTNQQSARLMFYHDHAWGITRLNVYAGEAAGYLITDATEQKLIGPGGALEGLGTGIPLIIQDRTFVPQADQVAWQDPTWDHARWGGYGNLWFHHTYMPAQNPGDPGGMSAFGRWMYGPWFWPPAGDAKYGPISNPYFGMDPATGWTTPLATPCNLDDPATWQYQTDPFCEPALIPGTPNVSAGMEQFNDTPIVNGTAYPTITLEPKSYRLRILNAANDRFFNLQWYVGDPTTASTALNGQGLPIGPTEVALQAAELAAAQIDPVVFPTPDTSVSLPGPDWIQIGTEGGFLPAPVVVDGQQVTTWITDPTRFDVGNVDQHSLLVAPAERVDVVVDLSSFAGQTLILYNDAPAAFPARIPSYDYYTGAPDLSPVGAPAITPGFGPNTRTIMQVRVDGTPAAPFNLAKLRSAFSHKADGSGVFESGQPPIIVGQATYNSAYGTSFVAGGWCNSPTNPTARCDGFARISEQGGDLFKFDTLLKNPDGTPKQVSVKLEPKAIHDETNASSFDEFGRMQANLGVEVAPATPGLQNVVLHPYTFPTTEIIDASGLPTADVKVTPIASGMDGTQIWKITHNGVDTHPIHFHAYDVQVLNRVTWDNIIIAPDAAELGWKDTVRISPLEDTVVALRPIVPVLPFDLPNSIRLLSPMMVDGLPIALSSIADTLGLGMTAFAPDGEPIDVYNHYINFGAEYVYHCHILSHEEMDMMRPVSLAYPPVAPSGLSVTAPIGNGNNRHVDLSWTDNSMSETTWEVQRATSVLGPWTTLATVPTEATLQPTTGRSTGGIFTYSDVIGNTKDSYAYRVLAANVVGDTWDYANPAFNEIVSGGFPTVTVKSAPTGSATWVVAPAAPTMQSAALQSGPQVSVTWMDNATNEDSFLIERSADGGGTWIQVGTAPARNNTGSVTFVDATVAAGNTYSYRAAAVNAAAIVNSADMVQVNVPALPAAPVISSLVAAAQGGNERVTVQWIDVAGETGYTAQWSIDSTFTTLSGSGSVGVNTTQFTTGNIARQTWWFRVGAANLGGTAWSVPASVAAAP